MCNLNCYELIGATTLWILGIKEKSVSDCNAIFEHLNLLVNRAMHNDFLDAVHVDYDQSIRTLAETIGFEAFASQNQGGSIVHYSSQNMRPKKYPTVNMSGLRKITGSAIRRACYAWNGEQGCARKEDECRFGHICAKCGGKGHKRPACKE